MDNATFLLIPLTLIYFFSMVIYPFWDGNFDLFYLQTVWAEWQSFNAGVLLFLSSMFALRLTIYNETEQRKRNFLARKAFLPKALIEVSNYCRLSCKFVGGQLHIHKVPILIDSKLIFKDCIEYAEPCVAKYLAYMILRLQSHETYITAIEMNDSASADRINMILWQLGELHALSYKMYDFAAGQKEFDNNPIIFEEYLTSYRTLGINFNDFEGLENLTKKAIMEGYLRNFEI
ncbi:hypothetical protein [Nitrosomonas oligotropha]|uniref:hypothetical protein n=1 Tax=Nitrosomonas oligotropha TaxID=42354 RepID=UPI0011B1D88E|nr:hypothetical protein [Nitrosomonas oligotropha]